MKPILGKVLSVCAAVTLGATYLAYGVKQEIPVSTVTGRVLMEENKKPLPNATVTLVENPTVNPESDDDIHSYNEAPKRHVRVAETDENGFFRFRNVPSGEYRIEASGQAHFMEDRQIGVWEGKSNQADLVLKARDPYLDIYASQKVFTPGEQPHMELHGFDKSKNITVQVYKLSVDQIANQSSMASALRKLANDENTESTKIQVTERFVAKPDIEGVFVQNIDLKSLPEGIYYARCGVGTEKRGTSLIVSNIALVVKQATDRSLCFVTDIKTGKPISGAKVSVGTDASTSVSTDQNGLAEIRQKPTKVAIIATYQKSVAVADSYGSGNEHSLQGRIMVVTDRPIYRPGDEVQFKGVVRKLVGNNYELPGTGMVQVEIKDVDGNVVDTQSLPVSEHGTFHGRYTSFQEAKPGDYTIATAAFGIRGESDISISSYRKPEYTVAIKSDKPYYVLGDKAKATVECAYYFGGPVVGAKVKVYVYRTPIWSFDSDEDEDYDYNSSSGGEYSQEVEAITDGNGKAVIEFETASKDEPDQRLVDYQYNIHASVADSGDKYFDGEGSVKVMRGDVLLTSDPQEYVVAPGQSAHVKITTQTADATPKPVANQLLKIVVGREVYADGVSDFQPLKAYTSSTGPNGEVNVALPMDKTGSIVVRTQLTDSRKNVITSECNIWVTGSNYGWEGSRSRPTIVLDHRNYKPGDVAKAMIQTTGKAGSALVTVEVDDIMQQQVVDLSSGNATVNIPVTSKHAPNAFVTVAYVHEKKFYEATKRLNVDQVDRKLKVDVTADQKEYKPGDTVHLNIKSADMNGKPMSANVTLGVVDESIYAIQEDRLDPVKEMYPKRYNRVRTIYSFPEIYLDGGDKGGGEIPLRTKFKDTAAWMPEIQTDANGNAEVTLKLPDNLTEWRVTATACSDDTSVGKTTLHFKARKSLMVRVQGPTYLVVGDTQTMNVQVINDSESTANVSLRFDIDGVDAQSDLPKSVTVEPGKPTDIPIELSSTKSGEGSIAARAWIDGGASDGEKRTFRIEALGKLVETMDASVIHGKQSFNVDILDSSDQNSGRLAITVAPNVLGSMVQALDDLVDYPYGCVEQTMSRFVPAVLVGKVLDESGISKPDVTLRIPRIAGESYARLAKMRRSDGSWGWWANDEGSVYMTSLVLDGVEKASKVGYKPSPAYGWSSSTITGSLDYLQKESIKLDNTKPQNMRDGMYAAYVLGKFGRMKDAKDVINHFPLTPLGAQETAYAALANHFAGNTEKRNEFVATLSKMAIRSGPGAHWKEQDWSWGEENTGLALGVLATIDPQNPLIEPAVTYLMQEKKGDSWSSTRSTTEVLTGLCEYAKQHKAPVTESDATIFLNGKVVKTIHLSSQSMFQPDQKILIPASQLHKGRNTVDIQSSTGGNLYASVSMRQYDATKPIQPTDVGGIKVERTYHLMEVRSADDGTQRLLPSKKPVDRVKSGDLLLVELTITSSRDRVFVMIESPTPSNCRVNEREDPMEDWTNWWAQTVVRDDKVAFFATSLKAGVNKITYSMRAERTGKSSALPARAGNMYDPNQTGTSGQNILEVTR